MDQTQTGAIAGTAPASSEGAASKQQDPTLSRPANGGGVDAASAEGKRNSDQSDAGNGGEGDNGGRSREGRAERTIKSLKARIKELEASTAQSDDLSQVLQSTRVMPNQVQLPDYSQMTEVTPAQIQADLLKTAEQIVDIKMGALASTLEKKVTRKDAAAAALREIAEAKKQYRVLDETDEDNYNPELDEAIGNGYYEIFKANPSYSFTDYLKSFKPVLEAANTTASDGTAQGVGTNRGTSATRPTAATRRSAKSLEDMPLDELEAYIHAQNGR